MSYESPLDWLPTEWREYLATHGDHIGQRAQEGCKHARRVLDAYDSMRMATDEDTAGVALLAALRACEVHLHGMELRCAWCGALMQAGSPMVVSHGMCDACAAKYDE